MFDEWCLGDPSTEVPQYQIETEECEDGSSDKDVHVLRAKREKKGQYRQLTVNQSGRECEPSSFYPADNVPAHPQRVRSVQQPLPSPFQYVPLIHQIVQNRSPLRDEIIQCALRVLNKTVLS